MLCCCCFGLAGELNWFWPNSLQRNNSRAGKYLLPEIYSASGPPIWWRWNRSTSSPRPVQTRVAIQWCGILVNDWRTCCGWRCKLNIEVCSPQDIHNIAQLHVSAVSVLVQEMESVSWGGGGNGWPASKPTNKQTATTRADAFSLSLSLCPFIFPQWSLNGVPLCECVPSLPLWMMGQGKRCCPVFFAFELWPLLVGCCTPRPMYLLSLVSFSSCYYWDMTCTRPSYRQLSRVIFYRPGSTIYRDTEQDTFTAGTCRILVMADTGKGFHAIISNHVTTKEARVEGGGGGGTFYLPEHLEEHFAIF